jgi:hypothetical protein
MSSEWDIEEALAWVIWRDLRVVKVMQSDNLAAMLFYPPDKEGYGTLRFGGEPVPRRGQIVQMLDALRIGHIKARGRKNGEGDRVQITPEQWQDLIIRPSLPNGTQVVPEDGAGKGTLWKDLKISISELQSYFPTPGNKQKTNTKNSGDGTKDDEDECLLIAMKSAREKASCMGKRLSIRAAARQAAPKAEDSPYANSIVERLRKKYRKRYPHDC